MYKECEINRSPRCHGSLLNHGTKLSNFFESCNIVSCFFYFGDKIKGFMAIRVVPFHSFLNHCDLP